MPRQRKLGRGVAMVGAAMSRFGMFKDKDSRDFFVEAYNEMLSSVDKGVDPKDIDALYIGNFTNDFFVHQGHWAPIIADWIGHAPKPATRLEGACASSALALREGIFAIASGFYDIVLVGGVEQMSKRTTEEVTEGMAVRTDTEHVRRLQRTALELLLASHPIVCKSCPANGNCELQKIASFLHIKLKQKRFRTKHRDLPVDDSHPDITLDPNLCILCGKCIWACNEERKIGALNYAFRGDRTVISPFGGDRLVDTRCDGCGLCAEVCPVGAISKNVKKSI